MIIFTLLSFAPIALILISPLLILWVGRAIGDHLRLKGATRRSKILRIIEKEENEWKLEGKERRDSDEWENVERYPETISTSTSQQNTEWNGVVGFFHPFCNAGGGGERVLWAAIRATQKRWPHAKCVIYTGDCGMDKGAVLASVQNRFNITLHEPTIFFLYLSTRSWTLASSWPYFTLLGQSIGSMVVVWEAFSLLVPDIFIDSMGYAFSLALCKLLFRNLPTGAYVHYPTISTDMLASLTPSPLSAAQGINDGKGLGPLGLVKRVYWRIFAKMYSLAGGSIDIVMTNSSWTQDHILSLWGSWRSRFQKPVPVIVYPPVAVEKLVRAIEISSESEKKRQPIIVYLAQFRPEKNHRLILHSFAKFKSTGTPVSIPAKLVLIGSVRDSKDSTRVYELRLLAHELQIRDSVVFIPDATWSEVIGWLDKASIGVNCMWNEHFGIGVVEYQAAGLVPVVHNSGGPKKDIVIMIEGMPTGFHATTSSEYAEHFEAILGLPDSERVELRKRGRKNTERFTDDVFDTCWNRQLDKLVQMQNAASGPVR